MAGNIKINELLQDKFLQIPKQFFLDPEYKKLSSDAKILYGLLRDRLYLSQKNNWINNKGEVYLIFKRDTISDLLDISNKTCVKIFKELREANLIEEEIQGQNKPNLIYIKHIEYREIKSDDEIDIIEDFKDEIPEEKPKKRIAKPTLTRKCKNYTSGGVKITLPEVYNLHPNNTNINNTENNKTNKLTKVSVSSFVGDENIIEVENKIKNNIDWENMTKNIYKSKLQKYNELLLLLLDMYFNGVEIEKKEMNQYIVQKAIMNIDYLLFINIIDYMDRPIPNIKNPKNYLKALIYNQSLSNNFSVAADVSTDLNN